MEAYDVDPIDVAVSAIVLKTNGGAVTLKRVRGGWLASVPHGEATISWLDVSPSAALVSLARAL